MGQRSFRLENSLAEEVAPENKTLSFCGCLKEEG
jgi:hypothetical protein